MGRDCRHNPEHAPEARESMIRVVIENILLFLLPTLIYFAYVYLVRAPATDQNGNPANPVDDAPLMWLFVAGACLVIATLIAFSSTTGGKPGEAYEPPSVKDGHVEDGRVR